MLECVAVCSDIIYLLCVGIYTVYIIMQDLDQDTLKAEPLIFCHFAAGISEPKYMAIPSWEVLKKTLEEALDSYNELNTIMNLVLFEDAMQHV